MWDISIKYTVDLIQKVNILYIYLFFLHGLAPELTRIAPEIRVSGLFEVLVPVSVDVSTAQSGRSLA